MAIERGGAESQIQTSAAAASVSSTSARIVASTGLKPNVSISAVAKGRRDFLSDKRRMSGRGDARLRLPPQGGFVQCGSGVAPKVDGRSAGGQAVRGAPGPLYTGSTTMAAK